MRLLGEINDGPIDVAGPDTGGFPCGDDRTQIGEAPSGSEISSCGSRISNERAQPLQDLVLDANARGAGHEGSRGRIRDRSQEVSNRGVIEVATGNVGKEPRCPARVTA